MIAAGSRGMMGAARLCALGALRGGAGLVTVAVPESEKDFLARGPWEPMTLPLPARGGAFTAAAARSFLDHAAKRAVSAVVLGPGLSLAPGAVQFAAALWSGVRAPLVADADALNAASALKFPRRKDPLIVTPHPGEAARLLATSTVRVQAARERTVLALSAKVGAVAVLKGAGTLVSDGERIFRNSTGHPGMASGGMGDVLAGLMGALLAQVRADSPDDACLRAAVCAAWMHGRAGDLAGRDLGPAGLRASDVADRLPRVFKEIW